MFTRAAQGVRSDRDLSLASVCEYMEEKTGAQVFPSLGANPKICNFLLKDHHFSL